MTSNNEKEDSEQRPKDIIPQKQDTPDKSDNLSKPTILDLQSNTVICNDLPLNRKDGKANDNFIVLENDEKKID